jgi:hypothetical protein
MLHEVNEHAPPRSTAITPAAWRGPALRLQPAQLPTTPTAPARSSSATAPAQAPVSDRASKARSRSSNVSTSTAPRRPTGKSAAASMRRIAGASLHDSPSNTASVGTSSFPRPSTLPEPGLHRPQRRGHPRRWCFCGVVVMFGAVNVVIKRFFRTSTLPKAPSATRWNVVFPKWMPTECICMPMILLVRSCHHDQPLLACALPAVAQTANYAGVVTTLETGTSNSGICSADDRITFRLDITLFMLRSLCCPPQFRETVTKSKRAQRVGEDHSGKLLAAPFQIPPKR